MEQATKLEVKEIEENFSKLQIDGNLDEGEKEKLEQLNKFLYSRLFYRNVFSLFKNENVEINKMFSKIINKKDKNKELEKKKLLESIKKLYDDLGYDKFCDIIKKIINFMINTYNKTEDFNFNIKFEKEDKINKPWVGTSIYYNNRSNVEGTEFYNNIFINTNLKINSNKIIFNNCLFINTNLKEYSCILNLNNKKVEFNKCKFENLNLSEKGKQITFNDTENNSSLYFENENTKILNFNNSKIKIINLLSKQGNFELDKSEIKKFSKNSNKVILLTYSINENVKIIKENKKYFIITKNLNNENCEDLKIIQNIFINIENLLSEEENLMIKCKKKIKSIFWIENENKIVNIFQNLHKIKNSTLKKEIKKYIDQAYIVEINDILYNKKYNRRMLIVTFLCCLLTALSLYAALVATNNSTSKIIYMEKNHSSNISNNIKK